MTLHPFVAAFMVVWLGAVGAGTIAALTASGSDSHAAFLPAGMFVFGVALTAGGFYPEAFKARHLLEHSVEPDGA
jgi:hypothetical protein